MKWPQNVIIAFSVGSLIFTLASHDVKKDLAIVDHLFVEVSPVINLLTCICGSCIIYALVPLFIEILSYLGILSTSFDIMFIFQIFHLKQELKDS